jgi:hypothetical protein
MIRVDRECDEFETERVDVLEQRRLLGCEVHELIRIAGGGLDWEVAKKRGKI